MGERVYLFSGRARSRCSRRSSLHCTHTKCHDKWEQEQHERRAAPLSCACSGRCGPGSRDRPWTAPGTAAAWAAGTPRSDTPASPPAASASERALQTRMVSATRELSWCVLGGAISITSSAAAATLATSSSSSSAGSCCMRVTAAATAKSGSKILQAAKVNARRTGAVRTFACLQRACRQHRLSGGRLDDDLAASRRKSAPAA